MTLRNVYGVSRDELNHISLRFDWWLSKRIRFLTLGGSFAGGRSYIKEMCASISDAQDFINGEAAPNELLRKASYGGRRSVSCLRDAARGIRENHLVHENAASPGGPGNTAKTLLTTREENRKVHLIINAADLLYISSG